MRHHRGQRRGGDLRAASRRRGGRGRPARTSAGPSWSGASTTQANGTKFVIYTGLDDPDLLGAAFRSGARGLVAKPAGLSVLVDALREVWRGGRYFDPRFAQAATATADGAAKALSGREAEILTLLARGLTGEEIAQRLVLSPETVRTHVRNAMAKLEARTRTEAVVKALEREEIQSG